jgi:phosphoribosylformylglycinamidine synthase
MFPGGFSYGDDIASGKIFANQILHRLAEPLNKFRADGKLLLGVCNGFQILIKSGLLPWGQADPAQANRDATLTWNDSGAFIDRWITLRADSDKCVFLTKGATLQLPIAHGEGKFVTRSPKVHKQLVAQDQIVVRYVGDNPNGSVDDVAGICDPTGRVFGLMPHPERFVDVTQHPNWTREQVAQADGLAVFTNARKCF